MTQDNRTTLVLLAAGMGSRYGGVKQIDGVGPGGEAIIDYSIYDALQAGFTDLCFVVRAEIRDAVGESPTRSRRWTTCRERSRSQPIVPNRGAQPMQCSPLDTR